MRSCLLFLAFFGLAAQSRAEAPRVLPDGQLPKDARLGELRTLNSYFPFKKVAGTQAWNERQAQIRHRILLSQGLWPEPTKTDLNAVVHGRIEREQYVVDRVYFESIPGHFVTGNLYRPKNKKGPFPGILSPHGHWSEGRFQEIGEAQVKQQIEKGAEENEIAAKYLIQARAVQLARMGCVVFVYDMTGNADSIQIGHRPDHWEHLDLQDRWGFFSAQAELRLQNMMGLQTWNSVRALDFLCELDDVDQTRLGVTGASGGGTQSMVLAAIDDRIAAAMPCVMVSTSMQGGCTCENAPYLRVDQGNIDIAAAIAPRPLGLTAADDWTKELETKGYPDLLALYEMLGHKDRLTAAFHIQFKHNYNYVNRKVMYGFFNRHFELGFDEPINETEFVPLAREDMTVWTEEHPAPSGRQRGDSHEARILRLATMDSDTRIRELMNNGSQREFEQVVGKAWKTMLRLELGDVGNATFEEHTKTKLGDVTVQLGLLSTESLGQQLPTLVMGQPKQGVIVWVTDEGKSQLFGDQQFASSAQLLVQQGYQVVCADLLGQGEFAENSAAIKTQRHWFQRKGTVGWEKFSGYTYGFNDSLLAQRCHDVLALISYASTKTSSVTVVGMGKHAGAIALAATSQSMGKAQNLYADLSNFRFVDLREQFDPMFLPGAVKYQGVAGLLRLCGQSHLEIANVHASVQTPEGCVTHSARIDLLQKLTKR